MVVYNTDLSNFYKKSPIEVREGEKLPVPSRQTCPTFWKCILLKEKIESKSESRYSWVHKVRVVVKNTVTKRLTKPPELDLIYEIIFGYSCSQGLKNVQLVSNTVRVTYLPERECELQEPIEFIQWGKIKPCFDKTVFQTIIRLKEKKYSVYDKHRFTNIFKKLSVYYNDFFSLQIKGNFRLLKRSDTES